MQNKMSIRDWLWAMREMICGQSRRSPGGVYLARQVAGQHPLMQLEALPCRPYFQIQETLLLRRWKVWIKREKKGKRNRKRTNRIASMFGSLDAWTGTNHSLDNARPEPQPGNLFRIPFLFFFVFFWKADWRNTSTNNWGRPLGGTNYLAES